MDELCVHRTTNGKCIPRRNDQRLLRNMGVHSVVLDLLQIPYDRKEDVRMNELLELAHQFLQDFCLGDRQNQVLLHKSIDLFLTPGVSSSMNHLRQIKTELFFLLLQLLEAKTICAIFRNNTQLCKEVNKRVIEHFIQCIENQGRHVQYLQFLQTIVNPEGQFIKRSQDLVMQELVNADEDVLVFYNDKASFNYFIDLMRHFKDPNQDQDDINQLR